MCDGVDPYTLRHGTDTTSSISAFPKVSRGNIVNYLVFSTKFVTLDEMNAFNSLELHNYFTGGWVKSLSAKELCDHKVILLAELPCQCTDALTRQRVFRWWVSIAACLVVNVAGSTGYFTLWGNCEH
ncbi:hypothetical protein HPB50_026690 [Hyalomma asiaticum]|uniref:Uncharacterized protein n=1 Tax=Hyalomma asiaticum TaxID=266040 RepID=A0ACB7TRA6_HYAAI|nr:hypothetical protein HPB50_026690 [Hyalomma asiaticum]